MLNFQDNTIAIIDSGIGGISILNQMIEYKISNRYIYFADNLYMPYGNKSKEFIKERIIKIIRHLQTKYNVRYIVLACNTASSCVKDEELENNTLSVHMSRLRSKIGNEFIETIRGFEYRFVGKVYKDIYEAVDSAVQVGRTYEPNPANFAAYEDAYARFEKYFDSMWPVKY